MSVVSFVVIQWKKKTKIKLFHTIYRYRYTRNQLATLITIHFYVLELHTTGSRHRKKGGAQQQTNQFNAFKIQQLFYELCNMLPKVKWLSNIFHTLRKCSLLIKFILFSFLIFLFNTFPLTVCVYICERCYCCMNF